MQNLYLEMKMNSLILFLHKNDKNALFLFYSNYYKITSIKIIKMGDFTNGF